MAGQLEKGALIGQYEVIAPLGKGGMASVYRAYQPSLDREVAVKIMAEQYATDPSFVERFRREARSIARLRHPNILTVYDAGEDKGLLYIVMELVEGQTLKDELGGKPLPLDKAGKIIDQVAGALEYANKSGIIHRDVKPSNVLIDAHGRAVLSDFGIAKMAEAKTQLTSTGTGVGTPDYMSPEQAMGEELDARSDEYSLGVMLYEMLTGRPPFTGDTPIAVVMGHVSKPLPSPRQLNPDIPPSVERVLAKALSKKAVDRYDGCGQFNEALQEAIRNRDKEPSGAPVSTYAATQVEHYGQPRPGSGSYQTFQSNPEAERLYQDARRLEAQNNFYGAFEVFNNLNSRFPSYRDVSGVLGRYRAMGYGTAQGGPQWGNQVPSGTAYNAPANTYSRPASGYYGQPIQPAKKSGNSLPLILGVISVLAIAAIVVVVVLLVTAKKDTGGGTITGSDNVPSYSGSTALTLPQDVANQFDIASVPNGKLDAFTTSDDTAKIKSFYQGELQKNGWQDKSSALASNSDTIKQIESVGGFILLYQKGDKGVGIIAFPGSLAGLMGINGVNQKDSLVLVVTGTGSSDSFFGSSKTAATTTEVASNETTTAPEATTAEETATTAAPTTAPTKPATTSAATTAANSGNGAAPAYPGASSLTIPDSFKQQVEPSLTGEVKNGKIDAFKTADAPDKVKSYYTDYFKKGGWSDQNAAASSVDSQFASLGGFFIMYQKGNTAVGVMGLPGTLASAMGFTDVDDTDTLIMVISGQS